MTRMSLAVACLLLVVVPAVGSEPVQVMTWNIRYDNPDDGPNGWPRRKDWLAEIVRANNIEIAGFQEVLAAQLADLKQRLPDLDAYGVGRDDGRNAGEFSPIFFNRERFELLDKATLWLSPTPDKPGSKGWDAALPRIATWVKLLDRRTKSRFFVINTHFDHRGEQARTESAALLVKIAQQQFAGHPVILTGDLNTTPRTPPYQTLTGAVADGSAVLFDTYETTVRPPVGPNSTWNGFEAIVPGQRIDFVLTTNPIRTLELRILDDRRDGCFPSDHLPVVTKLEWPHE